LINQLDEYGGVTFTNRWGIYQGGASDTNYFAANTLINTLTSIAASKFQVKGTGTTSSTYQIYSTNSTGSTFFYVRDDGILNATGINGNSAGFGSGSGTQTSLTLTGGSANLQFQFTSGSTDATVYNSSGGGIVLKTLSGANALYVNGSGNTGLGTTTIGSKLQVNGNAAIGYSASTAAPTNGIAVSGYAAIGGNLSNISGQNAAVGVLTVSSSTNYWGVVEVNCKTDADGQLLGAYLFTDSGSAAAYNLPAYIGAWLEGSTATKRGANIRFLTQPDNAASGGALERMRITNGGSVLIGTATAVASASLVVSSTTQGFLPPVMTTAQKNAISSPAAGLVVFDSTLAKLCVYASGAWQTITSV
jgi:hypothetical protein